jgi:hypothetical protein
MDCDFCHFIALLDIMVIGFLCRIVGYMWLIKIYSMKHFEKEESIEEEKLLVQENDKKL